MPGGGTGQHYLRIDERARPGKPRGLPARIGTDRGEPVLQARRVRLARQRRAAGVQQQLTARTPSPSVSGPANETISQSLIEQMIQFHVANTPETPNAIPAPACNQQGPFTFNGHTSQFPQVVYSGKQ